MNYRYEIPSDTHFRNYTIEEAVTDLDPDGFTGDEITGDAICESILDDAGLTYPDQWDRLGSDGAMRLLYWASDNDAGANAMGEIVKTPSE